MLLFQTESSDGSRKLEKRNVPFASLKSLGEGELG
jgi:hypothetical protein